MGSRVQLVCIRLSSAGTVSRTDFQKKWKNLVGLSASTELPGRIYRRGCPALLNR